MRFTLRRDNRIKYVPALSSLWDSVRRVSQGAERPFLAGAGRLPTNEDDSLRKEFLLTIHWIALIEAIGLTVACFGMVIGIILLLVRSQHALSIVVMLVIITIFVIFVVAIYQGITHGGG